LKSATTTNGVDKGILIGGRRVKLGEVAEIHLKVSETVTHLPARIAITVVRGINPGPILFLTGAVHGDEINGVAVVLEVLDKVNPQDLHGTLVAIPVVNQFGFPTGNRYLPDRRDLNRSFPGSPDGHMAARIADTLFQKVIKKCDAGIDLHTAAIGRANLCHVRGHAENSGVRDMMRTFGTPIMMEGEGPKGALRRAATEAGVPTMIFEAGEPNRFQPHVIDIGRDGIFRVMRHLGMWKKRVSAKPGVQVLIKRSDWDRADHGGILDLRVEPGDLVRKGQKIAIIHNPFGKRVDAIKASFAGVVLGVATQPLTNPGEAIVHIGHLQKTLQRVKAYVKAGGDMGHVNWNN
jgi:predicted deacylase